MSNPIDRQAAIDAIKNADVIVLYHDAEPVDEAIEEAIWATKRSAEASVEGLPSAQPEIIKCKECKYCDASAGMYWCNERSKSVFEDEFCSCAERRVHGSD